MAAADPPPDLDELRADLHAALDGDEVFFQEVGILGLEEGIQVLLHGLVFDEAGLADHDADGQHVHHPHGAYLQRDVAHGGGHDLHVFTFAAMGTGVGVDYHHSAGADAGAKLVQRRLIQGHQNVWVAHDGRGDGAVGNHGGDVGRSAAHFGSVGRQPGNVLSFLHARLGDEFANGENALSAESGADHFSGHHSTPSPLSRNTPGLKKGSMFSRAQSRDLTGSMPQLVGQVLTNSMKVKPRPSLL